MLQRSWISTIIAAVLLVSATSCDSVNQTSPETTDTANETAATDIIKDQYIVVLNDGQPLKKETAANSSGTRRTASQGVDRDAFIQSANAMLSDAGVQPQAVQNYYSHAISGFAVSLSDAEVEALDANNRVKYIEPDRRIQLQPYEQAGKSLPAAANKGNSTSAPGDFVPYGITRVGGSVDGTGEFAWVIDTGIDLDHPDLNVDTQYSRSFVNGESSPNDRNGHGTHVAGTIGALSNGEGVIGVSPGTTLFAVKVLNSQGSGSYSAIISGIDYVAQYAFSGEVANLSLGGPASAALDDAIRNCANAGVKVVVAAGNDATNANSQSPARVNGANILTVSAIDSNDNFASFSNFANPPIDWAAPGVGVWSTWLDGGYNQISGTSMASPHVAGLQVTGTIAADGTANGDPDGNPDPIAVRN